MEFHELANLFPMFTPEEMETLRASMRKSGYSNAHPIVLYEGKILDGRNRFTAAKFEALEPVFIEFTGDDDAALQFVIEENLARRHLNETQRGIVVSRIANMTRGGTGSNQYESKTANWQNSVSLGKAAEMMNVSERTAARIRAVEKAAPELLPKMERGEMTAHEAMKIADAKVRGEQRAELAESARSLPQSERWNVYLSSIDIWKAPRQYDFIITDPPYPKEFLPLYEILAIRAAQWLKPGGLLVAMCGQSYLEEIYEMIGRHLKYYWTAAYLTPGQPTPLRQVNVNTTWKPLLIYSTGEYKGKIFGDVFTSDGNDKSFHKWGQSESGMLAIVKQICLPGQYILDPFCGAGTTGIAALRHGCLFDGLDIDEQNIGITKARLHDAAKE